MAAPTIGRRAGWSPKAAAKIDYGHPLSYKLNTLVLSGADPTRDLVTGNRATTYPAAIPSTNSQWGDGVLFQSDAVNYRYEWSATAKPCPAPPWSVLALLGKKTDNALHYCPVVSSGGASTGLGWSVSTGNATTSASAALTFGSVAVYSFAGLPADGSSVWMLVTVDVYGGTARCYLDGKQLATATVGTADHAGASTGFMLGCTKTSGSYTNGSPNAHTMAAVWTRCLTAADAAALFADPFCMLRI